MVVSIVSDTCMDVFSPLDDSPTTAADFKSKLPFNTGDLPGICAAVYHEETDTLVVCSTQGCQRLMESGG